jgi:ABC-type lipoprotein export system ATPase subunit
VLESWPDKGAIEFKNVTVRYHQYGVAVLKSVSFAIGAGEKIAIVGRSGMYILNVFWFCDLVRLVTLGSGKTTLLSTFIC